MTPKEFLNLLWGAKPVDQYVLLWTWPDKRSHWFIDVEKAAGFAATIGLQNDVHVGVGCSKEQYGSTRRCQSEEISGLSGIGTNLDLLSEAHKKALPPTISDALKILPAAMPPSIIISTGNGVHPWWLFKEPLIFDSDLER
jgi:putative DNA primase/helicase